MTSSSSIPFTEPSRGATSPRRSRSFFPSFRLRTLLIVAVVFCLLFGWIGRGVHRVRQEDAAMESLMRAGATTWMIEESFTRPQTMTDPSRVSFLDRTSDRLARIVGWSTSPRPLSPGLQVLDRDDAAADEALAALAFFPDVEELSLSGEAFDDASIQKLDILPRLRSLTLTHTRVTAEGLAAIPAPERIRTLSCEAPPGDETPLVGIARLAELRSLGIGHPTISQEEMDAVASHPKLEALTVEIDRPLCDDLFETLRRSESLRELYVSLRDTGLSGPRTLPSLPIPPTVERFSIDGLHPSELPQIVPGRDLKIFMLMASTATPTAIDDFVPPFSAEHPTCQVQVWGWCTSGGPDVVYLAGRQIRPGTTEPLAQAAEPLTSHER